MIHIWRFIVGVVTIAFIFSPGIVAALTNNLLWMLIYPAVAFLFIAYILGLIITDP